ncbi:MAG: prolipoprotein diacylglyceryl transferase [Caldilineales bacterium]|nr:prolipoprotein diacylglyceryl transferase [Caldilineales bacterium]MDW8317132.1 prolipoprotein diacylglyceryl transferase [Anaerolineae bacterium]
MLPTIPLGPLRLQTYGTFLLLAFWLGLWLAARRGPRYGVDGDHLYNAGFAALLSGIAAARLGHVAAFFEVYRTDPLQVFSLSPAALLPIPGLVGAGLGAWWYVRRHRLAVAAVADAAAPGLLLAAAVAGVGAFLAGRTVGTVTALPWGVALPAAPDLRRHPTALYEAVAALVWLAVVLAAERRGERWPGRTAWLSLFGYAALRLFLEPLRAGGVLLPGGWRAAQVVTWCALALSGWRLGRGAAAQRPHPSVVSAPASEP